LKAIDSIFENYPGILLIRQVNQFYIVPCVPGRFCHARQTQWQNRHVDLFRIG
jgi:hypothetical protein